MSQLYVNNNSFIIEKSVEMGELNGMFQVGYC